MVVVVVVVVEVVVVVVVVVVMVAGEGRGVGPRCHVCVQHWAKCPPLKGLYWHFERVLS